MSNIIWKSFKLGNFLKTSSNHVIKSPKKSLKTYDYYKEGTIANVTATSKNNGVDCYLDMSDEIKEKMINNVITIAPDGSAGVCFYHPYYIISTGHNKIINIFNDKLKKIFDENTNLYYFLTKLFTKIFFNNFYGFSRSINKNDFDKNIILLPLIEVSKTDDYIWEDNNNYYTLAVDYIKKLMDSAKKLKEEKTIKLYEKERAKYEAERVKYEAAYVLERSLLVWKNFTLDYLFDLSANHVIDSSLKKLKTYNAYHNGLIANVTATKENNGIKCYIDINEEVEEKKKKNLFTIAPDAEYAGICFYHPYYIISTGHSKIIEFKDSKINNFFNKSNNPYYFFARLLTKIFCKTFYGFSKSITKDDFGNTSILLPCLKVSCEDEWFYQENEHYYTLATNYISYLYLTGRINKYQKLIDEYTYK